MISSPCNKICVIDGLADICIGCGRSLPEIARWGRMSEDERLAIMATLPERMRAKGFTPPATT
ncbi:MAG TPA: DUF1289 domain-containing protein [Rhizomicrobium sp.]